MSSEVRQSREEALQDAIFERLCIPTKDADINWILQYVSAAGYAVVPKEIESLAAEQTGEECFHCDEIFTDRT